MLLVVVLSATCQLESSNDGCDSGDSGANFHVAAERSGSVIGAGPGSCAVATAD